MVRAPFCAPWQRPPSLHAWICGARCGRGALLLGQPDLAVHNRSLPWRASDSDRSANGLDAIRHTLDAGPVVSGSHFETAAVVLDVKHEFPLALRESDQCGAGPRVLRDVLHGFEGAEVNGGLNLPPIAADAVHLDRGGYRCLAALCPQSRRKALVRQQWRVDAARQVAEV